MALEMHTYVLTNAEKANGKVEIFMTKHGNQKQLLKSNSKMIMILISLVNLGNNELRAY